VNQLKGQRQLLKRMWRMLRCTAILLTMIAGAARVAAAWRVVVISLAVRSTVRHGCKKLSLR
jgi:hypothetical protein